MEFAMGGTAACLACLFTNPLEVVKTRVQLQGELKARGQYSIHYRNIIHAFYTVAKADGFVAMQKGLVPALWYQFFMNGVRLGSFDYMEKLGLTKGKDGLVSLPKSIAAGALSGSLGAFVASPLYMIKTHLQAQSAPSVAVGHQYNHRGLFHALQTTYQELGIKGLWRGVSAAMVRVTWGSSVQLATFSKSKNMIDESGLMFTRGSWINTLAAGMLSGVTVVAFMTPLDLVSTRLYNQPVSSKGAGLYYSSLLDCIVKIFRTEGLLGFYKGWSASLLRTGPHTVLSLLFWSELRKFQLNFTQTKNAGSHTALDSNIAMKTIK